jgi:hypothetical protein
MLTHTGPSHFVLFSFLFLVFSIPLIHVCFGLLSSPANFNFIPFPTCSPSILSSFPSSDSVPSLHRHSSSPSSSLVSASFSDVRFAVSVSSRNFSILSRELTKTRHASQRVPCCYNRTKVSRSQITCICHNTGPNCTLS